MSNSRTKLDEQTRESILKALTAYANQLYTTMGIYIVKLKANLTNSKIFVYL